jgi:hypothetical protein
VIGRFGDRTWRVGTVQLRYHDDEVQKQMIVADR